MQRTDDTVPLSALYLAPIEATPPQGAKPENAMSHKPPKEGKKKALHTAKEKKTAKQQKKHAGDAVPLIKQ